MAGDRYMFEGLEAFENRLRRVSSDVDYLVVWDRTERKTEDSLGRFALTLTDALPYLEQDKELSESEDPEPEEAENAFGMSFVDEADEDTEEVEDDERARAERLLGRAPGPADYAVAAGRWLRDLAIRNMGGDELRRFRVKAYSPKAARVIETTTFSCRDTDHEPAPPAPLVVRENLPELQIPTPTFEAIETHATTKGMKALGDNYAQFGNLLMAAFSQLQNINNAVVNNLHRDLQHSRHQVDQLTAAVLTQRVTETELAEQRAASERVDDTRTELARHALQQLGEGVKALLVSKGLTPELNELVALLGQSPELMTVLQDPDVRLLMQEPGNIAAMAVMLKQAAGQARSARAATETFSKST